LHIDSYIGMHLQIELMHRGNSRSNLHASSCQLLLQSELSLHGIRSAISNNNKVFLLKEYEILCLI